MGRNLLLLVSTGGGVSRIFEDFARLQLKAILPRKAKCESQRVRRLDLITERGSGRHAKAGRYHSQPHASPLHQLARTWLACIAVLIKWRWENNPDGTAWTGLRGNLRTNTTMGICPDHREKADP